MSQSDRNPWLWLLKAIAIVTSIVALLMLLVFLLLFFT
jgi:hypothetical protein